MIDNCKFQCKKSSWPEKIEKLLKQNLLGLLCKNYSKIKNLSKISQSNQFRMFKMKLFFYEMRRKKSLALCIIFVSFWLFFCLIGFVEIESKNNEFIAQIDEESLFRRKTLENIINRFSFNEVFVILERKNKRNVDKSPKRKLIIASIPVDDGSFTKTELENLVFFIRYSSQFKRYFTRYDIRQLKRKILVNFTFTSFNLNLYDDFIKEFN